MPCKELDSFNNIILLRDQWSKYNGTLVKGNAYIRGRLCRGTELAQYIDDLPLDAVGNYASINGFFCSIKQSKGCVQIASDRIRSYPLFYMQKENCIYISDDPYELRDRAGVEKQNELSRLELMLSRYVTGSETLYKEIRQIVAGEVIDFSEDTSIPHRYYKYLGKHNLDCKKRDLIKIHEQTLFNAFSRLIEYAAGRTLVIPLSGGYDSRLIAVMLKILDYGNVVTFTYGLEGNPEQVMSKRVADRLGFKWIFVPYTNEKSFEWYNSTEYKQYERYADNLSSICFDREWPAVFELAKGKLIPDDAVFVPGHSGDFLSGRLLPYRLSENKAGFDDLIEVILENQYTQWDWSGKRKEIRNELGEKIIRVTELNEGGMNESMLDAYDMWEWQERQAKYIVNSVRVYEYFGYKWWLPFWDKEIVDFWSAVSNKWRKQRRLFSHHIALLYSKTAGIRFGEASLREDTMNEPVLSGSIRRVKRIITISPFESIARSIYRMLKVALRSLKPTDNFASENRDNDWEVSSGRIGYDAYKQLLPYLITRDSYKTLRKLGYVSSEDKFISESVLNMLRSLKEEIHK